MKNERLSFGIFVIILLFGITIFSCDENLDDSYDSVLNGTWIPDEESNYILKLNKEIIERFNQNYDPMNKGTFTVNDGKLIENLTHIHGNSIQNYTSPINDKKAELKWYTKNELQVYLSIDDETMKNSF